MYKGWCFRQQLLPCQRRVRNELLTPASYPDSSCVESLRQTRASQSAGGGLLGLHRPTSVRGQFVTSEVPILPLCGPSREDNAGCPTKVPSRCTRMGETRALTAAPATGHPRAPGGTSEGHTRRLPAAPRKAHLSLVPPVRFRLKMTHHSAHFSPSLVICPFRRSLFTLNASLVSIPLILTHLEACRGPQLRRRLKTPGKVRFLALKAAQGG